MSQMPTLSPQPGASIPMQVGSHELPVVGAVAISRMVAYTRHVKDTDRAPRMTARIDLPRMSAWEVASLDRVAELVATHDINASRAAERFADALSDFGGRLRPLDWAERLFKTYITLGLLIDFGMVLNESLRDPSRRGFVHELSQDPINVYAIVELEETIAANPQLAARPGLWGRCAIGERVRTFQGLLRQPPELLGQMAQEQLHSVLTQGAVSRMKGLGLRV